MKCLLPRDSSLPLSLLLKLLRDAKEILVDISFAMLVNYLNVAWYACALFLFQRRTDKGVFIRESFFYVRYIK